MNTPGSPAQALDLAAAPPVPGDAAPMTTVHLLDDTGRHLAHASAHLDAAMDAKPGDLRGHHTARCAASLDRAHRSAHDLAAHLRARYPAEGSELDTLTGTIGLAVAVSDQAKTATTAHLVQTTCNHLGHTIRHVQALADDETPEVQEFNADHARTHLDGAVEHVGKLHAHFADNYPAEAGHLDALRGTAAQIAGAARGSAAQKCDDQQPASREHDQRPVRPRRRMAGRVAARAPRRARPVDPHAGGLPTCWASPMPGQRGGRKPATSKDIISEWRKSKDDLVRKHLNLAGAHLDAGDYDAARRRAEAGRDHGDAAR